jgi:hypothetical protein
VLAPKECPFATTLNLKNVISGSFGMCSIKYGSVHISCRFVGSHSK